ADMTAVDNLMNYKQFRFYIIYQFLSLVYNRRLTLKIPIKEYQAVSSLNKLYNCSNWLEREIWDLFGIFFTNHPDLRRILTDYGFQGFPLRKDFPVYGFFELRYDNELK